MGSEFFGLIVVLVLIFLIFQRWFWIAVTWIGGLASLFGMLASIIHFQILAAIGLFFLMWILFGASSIISTNFSKQ